MTMMNEYHRSARRQRNNNEEDTETEDNVFGHPSPAPSEAPASQNTTLVPSVVASATPEPSPETPTPTTTPTNAPTPAPTTTPLCVLDPETRSFGVLDGDDVFEEVVSFVYQVVTGDGPLQADTLQSIETYMTEQMVVSLMPCSGKRKTKSPITGDPSARTTSSSFLSRKRRKPDDDGVTRQLQVSDIDNPFVGLSSEPEDLMIGNSEIPCTGSYQRGVTYCVVVEGRIRIATNSGVNLDEEQTEKLYRSAIREAVEETNDWANGMAGSPDDLLVVSYRNDSRESSVSTTLLFNPEKVKDYWIPGVTILCFFFVLMIVFLVHDANSPLKKRWEEQRLKREGSGRSGAGGQDDDEDNATEEVEVARISSFVATQDDTTSFENGESGGTRRQSGSYDELHRPLSEFEDEPITLPEYEA